MKILLLGKNGMLGSDLLRAFSGEDHGLDIFALGHDELDVTDHAELERMLRDIHPDLLINCVAMTDVDGCESDPDRAFAVNAEAVEVMAGLCGEAGGALLHVSTDYVFDGENEKGYDENAEPNPLNVYGKSKLEAERLIAKSGCNTYIVRTSLLFGENGDNFVKTIANLSKDRAALDLVTDQVCCATYAADLADAIDQNFVRNRMDFGTYHITNSGTCSRYDLAEKTLEYLGRELELHGVPSSHFKRPAKRPKNSILLNTKLKNLRSWEEALKVYVDINLK